MGIGYHREKAAVFVGPLVTYRQNVSIGTGLALLSQPVLLGRYSEGSTIADQLSTEQLHENVYRPTLYFTVNLRSVTAPFRSDDNASERD